MHVNWRLGLLPLNIFCHYRICNAHCAVCAVGRLRTADAFLVFRRERSDDRKCVCCSQAMLLDALAENVGKTKAQECPLPVVA